MECVMSHRFREKFIKDTQQRNASGHRIKQYRYLVQHWQSTPTVQHWQSTQTDQHWQSTPTDQHWQSTPTDQHWQSAPTDQHWQSKFTDNFYHTLSILLSLPECHHRNIIGSQRRWKCRFHSLHKLQVTRRKHEKIFYSKPHPVR